MARKVRAFHPRPKLIQPEDTRYRLIPLTQGQVTIINAEDFDPVNSWNWHAEWNVQLGGFYARGGPGGKVALHRFLVGIKGLQVDHKNGDTLDNRRENLRTATNQQNTVNTGISKKNRSGFKGVSWITSRKHWQATAKVRGKSFNLGYFDDPKEAAKAYDEFVLKTHGEFARLNFKENEHGCEG